MSQPFGLKMSSSSWHCLKDFPTDAFDILEYSIQANERLKPFAWKTQRSYGHSEKDVGREGQYSGWA